MITTKNYFELAQLAEASYAKFDLFAADKTKDALIAADFSDKQADLFLTDWQIVNNGHQPNTASGYSSTLFKSTDPGGGYVLAFRGTDWALDYDDQLKTNIGDIVSDGLATKQIVDMYNEWQCKWGQTRLI